MRRNRGGHYVRLGEWNVISDLNGQKYKSGEMMQTWDGLWVHHSEFESKHRQIDIIAHDEKTSIPWARPRKPDICE